MKLSEIIGMPVVSMGDGEKLGQVTDLLIDPLKLQIMAIVFGGKPGQGLLPFENVKNIGADAITIESAQLIQWVTGQLSTDTGRKATSIKDLTVVDGSGSALGSVHDIEFDSVAGQVISFHISRGGVFGIGAHTVDIPTANVRSVGASLITVELPATIESDA